VNSDAFFAAIRRDQFGGAMNDGQVVGVNALLQACAGWPLAWTAYALATAYHETARTMRPIRERGSGDGPDADAWDDYLQRYDTGKLAAALGNTPAADGDGVRYAGRGYVQLTGRTNYARAEAELGESFLADPDLALRPDLSAQILRRGMQEGWFTGKRMLDYLPRQGTATLPQFCQARRIINGTDRAQVIAAAADKFQSALRAAAW
jgi:putative chitinase